MLLLLGSFEIFLGYFLVFFSSGVVSKHASANEGLSKAAVTSSLMKMPKRFVIWKWSVVALWDWDKTTISASLENLDCRLCFAYRRIRVRVRVLDACIWC